MMSAPRSARFLVRSPGPSIETSTTRKPESGPEFVMAREIRWLGIVRSHAVPARDERLPTEVGRHPVVLVRVVATVAAHGDDGAHHAARRQRGMGRRTTIPRRTHQGEGAAPDAFVGAAHRRARAR